MRRRFPTTQTTVLRGTDPCDARSRPTVLFGNRRISIHIRRRPYAERPERTPPPMRIHIPNLQRDRTTIPNIRQGALSPDPWTRQMAGIPRRSKTHSDSLYRSQQSPILSLWTDSEQKTIQMELVPDRIPTPTCS